VLDLCRQLVLMLVLNWRLTLFILVLARWLAVAGGPFRAASSRRALHHRQDQLARAPPGRGGAQRARVVKAFPARV